MSVAPAAGVHGGRRVRGARYARRPGIPSRFRALYLGIPLNFIVIGWVPGPSMKILKVTLGFELTRAALWVLLRDDRFHAF